MIYYGEKILKIKSSSRDVVNEADYYQSLNGNYNVYNLKISPYGNDVDGYENSYDIIDGYYFEDLDVEVDI